jgi:hypothetical protein
VVALTGWCVVVTGLWPAIVGISIGDPLAWTRTQDAWRPARSSVLEVGWPASVMLDSGWSAFALLTLLVLLTLGLVLRPGARAWGPELRTWSVAYPGYLLLATAPVPSVIRWLILAFPLLWPFPEAAASASERRFRVVLITVLAIVGLAMQWVWVSTFLGATAPSARYP